MSQLIKAVLFDLNGTLIHQIRSERSHIAYTYAAFSKYDWNLTFESFETAWKNVHSRYEETNRLGCQQLRLRDLTAAEEFLYEPWYRENIIAIANELQVSISNRILEKITWEFQDSWVGGLRMPSQNRKVLMNLVHKGYQLGIVTNFQQPNLIQDILDDFAISEYFKTIIISASVGWRKPHPRLFELALEELNMRDNPGQVAFVGDNPEEDVQGAIYMGLHPILLNHENQYGTSANNITNILTLEELERKLPNLSSMDK
jgi:HAD superfamily hydrolase (TIGR01549 family)